MSSPSYTLNSNNNAGFIPTFLFSYMYFPSLIVKSPLPLSSIYLYIYSIPQSSDLSGLPRCSDPFFVGMLAIAGLPSCQRWGKRARSSIFVCVKNTRCFKKKKIISTNYKMPLPIYVNIDRYRYMLTCYFLLKSTSKNDDFIWANMFHKLSDKKGWVFLLGLTPEGTRSVPIPVL